MNEEQAQHAHRSSSTHPLTPPQHKVNPRCCPLRPRPRTRSTRLIPDAAPCAPCAPVLPHLQRKIHTRGNVWNRE